MVTEEQRSSLSGRAGFVGGLGWAEGRDSWGESCKAPKLSLHTQYPLQTVGMMVEGACRTEFLPEKRVVYGQLLTCTKGMRYCS